MAAGRHQVLKADSATLDLVLAMPARLLSTSSG